MTPYYGKYVLAIDFKNLSEQAALLKKLAEPLSGSNKFLINGLLRMIDEIVLQEQSLDTSVKVVNSEIRRASQPSQEDATLKKLPCKEN